MSLAREALLSVDDDGPRKKLMLGQTERAAPEHPEEHKQELPVELMPPVAIRRAPGPEVVKSYRINEACSAQVVWDEASGKCHYDLLEPLFTPDEEKTYDSIVAELHKKPRSELEAMKRIGGRERIRQKFERLCRERGISPGLKGKMRYHVERDFWGYKKIDGLLKDENVEDVSCNGYGSPVYVYIPEFESIPTNITFESEEELDDFILYLVQKGGKSISAAHPIRTSPCPMARVSTAPSTGKLALTARRSPSAWQTAPTGPPSSSGSAPSLQSRWRSCGWPWRTDAAWRSLEAPPLARRRR